MLYKDKYDKWLNSEIVDINTKEQLKKMTDEDINERFCQDLEFGTGGLRGIMEPGTNRINIYTIRKATQGLANEIISCGKSAMEKGVVIAYDSRNNSKIFAMESARVLSANHIKVYLFDSLRPTPELSFAVRFLKCIRGIVITASHNPKEYNGYKVYGEDGGQIPPKVAQDIIKYIDNTDIFNDVKITDDSEIVYIGKDVDDAYIDAVKKQSMNINIPDDFKIVYTPIHGSGNILVRRILSEVGAKNVFVVPEQEKPDGNFSTVDSPNPENKEAFNIAIEYAKKLNADIAIGTDPDSDRIGVVVKDKNNEFITLTGNQTGTLLCEFILRNLKANNKLLDNHTIVKTIVTTELVQKIAEDYGIKICNVLTGFKYIGEKIKQFENTDDNEFLFGLEESYGYLKGTYARDKDAVVASMLICEMAADYYNKGLTLYDGLIDIYQKYIYSKSALKTVTLKGISGKKKIENIMNSLRNNTSDTICNCRINEKIDYITGIDDMPKSNVIKYTFDDGWFAIRPSGTEPKIKFYFEFFGKEKSEVNKKSEMFDKSVECICTDSL